MPFKGKNSAKLITPMEILLLLSALIIYVIITFHLYNYLINIETHPIIILVIIIILPFPFSFPIYKLFIRFRKKKDISLEKAENKEIAYINLDSSPLKTFFINAINVDY